MKTFKLFISAALVLSLTGCSSDQEITYTPVAATVTAGIDGGLTRANGSSWETGDAIGISGGSYSNMKYKNISESSNAAKFEHDGGIETGIFFKDAEKHNFTAYYPFKSSEKISAGSISVNTSDQSIQKDFDFLFAPAVEGSRDKSELGFTFSHKMTRVVLQVNVDVASGILSDKADEAIFQLDGLKHEGTFNTLTGVAAPADNASVTNEWVLANPKVDSQTKTKEYTLILLPQTIAQNSNLTFRAVINGENFTCKLTSNLVEGVSYTYAITVKKTGLEVSECTISNWSDGNGKNGEEVDAEL